MSRSVDAVHMRRTLELARRRHGCTWPNPMVGAVVVRGDRVLGEGYHRVAGGAHAEVDALQRCCEDPADATLYVNLEPCAHHARTGPCTDLVKRSGLARVVIGTLDPNPEVCGRGAGLLRDAGIETDVGVLARECADVNEVYFSSRRFHRPHVTLKAATDLFGRTSTRTGESRWISGEEARAHGHHLRAVSQAIAVGSVTALEDDPRLTTRLPGTERPSPARVLFDSRLAVPPDAALFADDGVPVLVYTTARSVDAPAAARPPARAEVVVCGDGPRVDLAAALEDLRRREVVSLLVEGGATLAGAFVDTGAFDKVVRYFAPRVIGGDSAPGVLRGDGVARLHETPILEFVGVERAGPDLILTARRPLEIPCSRV